MSDLISRQAVDDAIYDYSRSCNVDYAQIMERIDKLPSAFDGMTNGEVIQALFPNANYESCKNFMQITSANICGVTFFWDWWNAPYQKGGGEE